jgi:peptide/nickel transport system ATP-binding protein
MSEPILKVSNYNIDFWVDGVWYPAAVDMNFEVKPGRVQESRPRRWASCRF